jgi:hypothetical protein
MAAFLSRAYKLPATKKAPFKDAAGTFFNDINRLAAAGITKGCNPPTNDMYCPSGFVTRGQMAAFLHRASKLKPPAPPPPPPPPGGDTVKPVITIAGANPVTVQLNSLYLDKGATATDNVDSDAVITGKIKTVNKVDTSTLGNYTVTYTVSDTAGNAAVPKVRTVKVVKDAPPPPPPPGSATQLGDFVTGYSDPTTPLTVAAIDPSGITYGPSDHLFITDAEIEEVATVWATVQANVFEVSRDGTFVKSYDLTDPGARASKMREPTGIAYAGTDAGNHVFYVTNDDTKALYRYWFDSTTGFTLKDSISTRATSNGGLDSPEGVTVDGAGNIYVVDDTRDTSQACKDDPLVCDDDNKTIGVYTWDSVGGFSLVRTMDLVALNPVGPNPKGPEGIAFDAISGNLFLVSQRDLPNALYEYETDGTLVKRYGMGHFRVTTPVGTPPTHGMTEPVAPQGIGFAPASADASPGAFYIADGGVDNNDDALERDGVIWEGRP